MRLLAAAAWGLWGAVVWTHAVAAQALMRGFFPGWAEALIQGRGALAAAALLAAAAALRKRPGLPLKLAAQAAAAAVAFAGPVPAAAAAWAPLILLESDLEPPCASDGERRPGLAAALVAAAACWGAWAAVSRPPAQAAAYSALLFASAAVVLFSAAEALGVLPRPRLLRTLAGWGAWAWVFDRLIVAPLGLGGAGALIAALSAAAGALCAMAWLGRVLGSVGRPGAAAAGLLCALGGGMAAAALESMPDWSHGAQGLLLSASWIVAWSSFQEAVPDPAWLRPQGRRTAAALAYAAALWAAAAAAGTRAAGGLTSAERTDAGTRVLVRLLHPPAHRESLFRTLRARGGRKDRPAPPWPVSLPPAAAEPGEKPDIFILVLDSLRPDYVGAYGNGSTFTPNLDGLARESLVFARAFTPYGGTILALQSLFAGVVVPPGASPDPFVPVNALERLLKEEGYRLLLAPDIVTRSLTSPPPAWETFDEDNDLARRACPALSELSRRLGPKRPGTPPVFAFAHLYDLHVSQVRPGAAARGSRFNPAYGEALRALDACVGSFVDALKRAGRWRNAVVVVTADHGDALGEEGRWGHSHNAFPEVLRIPLILRAPAGLRRGLEAKTAELASLTDLVATLGRLLGRRSWPAGACRGRPLLRAPAEAQAPRLEAPAASSYTPVFGVLDQGGGRLFLADALDRAFHLFAIPERGNAQRLPLDAAELASGIARLERVEEESDACRLSAAGAR